jgi:hypothetical protein
MAIYKYSPYGINSPFYGIQAPSGYIVEPFTAQSINYTTVQLNWQKPSSQFTQFRLIRNRFGYPVNETDGDILLDEPTWPGQLYNDISVIPGQYHYYGIYLLILYADFYAWVRAGVTATLAIQDYGSGEWMYQLIPDHMTQIDQTELTTDTLGNSFLRSYMGVIGWGLDYLKTQYAMAANVNNPMKIPLGDLMQLSRELGYEFEPEIEARLVRKGVLNTATVARKRGTLQGIAEEVEIVCGWDVDISTGYNLMLENDQGFFLNPVLTYALYNPTVAYNTGEFVTFNNFVYQCLITPTLNTPPTGTSASNAHWAAIYNADDTTAALVNPVTGGINTWECRFPALPGHVAPFNSLRQGVGLPNPQSFSHSLLAFFEFLHGGLRCYNTGVTQQNCEVKSIARTTTDIADLSSHPDPEQVILDGLPVPWVITSDTWSPLPEYKTGQIVYYQGQPFQALRASTGAAPPTNSVPTNEWQPIGLDRRIALMTSGQVSQNLNVSANQQVNVYPYMTWYDQWGNFISQVQARGQYTMVADVKACPTTPCSTACPYTATGTTFTCNSNGAFPLLDGVSLAVNDMFLLTGESNPANNGIWKLTSAGSVSTPATASRQYTAASHVGQFLRCYAGITNGDRFFWCQNTTPPTFGTTSITYSATGPFALNPNNIYFDSFTGGWGATLTGTAPEVANGQVWSSVTGAFTVDGFLDGTVHPTNAGTRSIATITAQSDCQVAVTFKTSPDAGMTQGIIFRESSSANYWRAGRTTLRKFVTGTPTTVATYTTPFSDLDRMTVVLNGSAITVLRNGVQVAAVTDSFNSTATNHGIIYEAT